MKLKKFKIANNNNNHGKTATLPNNQNNAPPFQSITDRIENLELKKCRCARFIPDKINKNVCGCLNALEKHDLDVRNNYEMDVRNDTLPTKWDIEKDVRDDRATDAYGEFSFKNKKSSAKSQFVRVSYRTDLNKMIELINDVWKISIPDLIISVTGGAKGFKLTSKQRVAFNRGLVNATLSTHALIITGGTAQGCMQLVGEAVKENITSLDPSKRISLLGVTNWTTLLNNETLTKKNAQGYIEYEPNADQKIRGANLDQNHTHFIIVDNAVNDYGGEIEFRSQLEAKLVTSSNNNCRIVVLALGGGPLTIEAILNATRCNSPCVFFKGSKEAADLMIELLQEFDKIFVSTRNGGDDEKTRLKKTIDTFGSQEKKPFILKLFDKHLSGKFKSDSKKESTYKHVLEIFCKPHLLNVYDCEPADLKDRIEMDEVILFSILKALNNPLESASASSSASQESKDLKGIFQSQLRLALKWNRADVISRFLFNNKAVKYEKHWLNDLMYEAIKYNRIEFINTFLDNGLDLGGFLTLRRLIKLYNDVPKNSLFYQELTKQVNTYDWSLIKSNRDEILLSTNQRVTLTLKVVGQTIERLLTYLYENKFTRAPLSLIDLQNTDRILYDTDEFGCAKPGVLTSLLYNINDEEWMVDEPFKNPDHELFVYSILCDRPEMAEIFHSRNKECIANYSFASAIYKSFSQKSDDECEKYLELASNYENKIIKIIDLADAKCPDKAFYLLMNKCQSYGNVTPLQFARISDNLNLLSHPCLQEFLTTVWYNKLLPDTSYMSLRVGLSILIPFLAPLICHFRETKEFARRRKTKTTTSTTTMMMMNSQENKRNYSIENDEEEEEEERDQLVTLESLKVPRREFKYPTMRDGEYPRTFRIYYNEYNEKLSYLNRMSQFFTTPLIKFIYDKFMYLIFLLLFSYVLLCDFYPIYQDPTLNPTLIATHLNIRISIIEVVIIVWVFSFIAESIRHLNDGESNVLIAKVILFFSSVWNWFDTVAIGLFTVALVLRFIPDSNCYLASRVIFCVDLIAWYMKALHTYTYFKFMGPKLIMIRKMSFELLSFVLIIFVFMFAFGIATTGMMYHNLPLDRYLLKYIFFPAYFIIGGEYYTRETIMGATSCSINDTERSLTDRYKIDDCPETDGAQATLFAYTIYVLIVYVLLVTLLIAIFTNTYKKIEVQSDKIWKNQRYTLIYDYFHKPYFLPPFLIFYYAGRALSVTFFRLIRAKALPKLKSNKNKINSIFFWIISKQKSGFNIYFNKPKEQKKLLEKWEISLSNEIEENEKAEENKNMIKRLELNLSLLNKLNESFDEILIKKGQTAKLINDLKIKYKSFID